MAERAALSLFGNSLPHRFCSRSVISPRLGRSARSRRYLKPHSGCLRCNRGGFWARRGHVIYSDVFAVAAVTAADVMFWFTPAGQRGPLRASRPRWPAPVGAWCCRARDGPELGRPGVPGDGRGSGRPQCHGQGSAARREAPWRRPPRRAGTEALGQRLDTARAGITRLRPKSFRCQLTRALGLQRRITPKRARRTSMTSTDDDLSHSCGGDMSTPQKCLPTRHYLQTTSDNRRYARRRGPWRE